MLGTKWIDANEPAELIHDNRRPAANLIVRHERVLPEEISALAGMQVTAPARTGFDLGRLGWLIIRASRDLLRYRRATFVGRVEDALLSRGLRW